MSAQFPDSPFWDFSLEVYGKPRVADSCIYLQDRYGMNVNVLLLCVWVGAAGMGSLAATDLNRCIRRTRDWQRTIVKPLRGIRRACGDEPLGVPDALMQIFRPLVQGTEIDAEHVEQLVLADTLKDRTVGDASGAGLSPDERSIDAQRSLLAYVEVSAIARNERLDECLRIICGAAIPGADLALLR